jgi:hypothetical protein
MNTSQPWDKVATNINDLLWAMGEDDVEATQIQQGRGFQKSKPLLRALPKPPSSSRYYFQKKLRNNTESSEFQKVINEATKLIQNAFSNNDYLLALRNITLETQCNELNKFGIIYTLNTIKAAKENKHKSMNLVLPTALAVYHGEPILRFMTQDYAAQKLAPYRPEPPRDTRQVTERLPSELRRTYGLSETPIK